MRQGETLTKNKPYTSERCYACNGPYNEDEWSERHTEHQCHCNWQEEDCTCPAPDVHERCCYHCYPTEYDDDFERRRRRGHDFWPSDEELQAMPKLYATERTPLRDRVVRWHYFTTGAACDWWLIEYDPETRDGFGYACLGGDHQNAEWGYVSLDELERLERPGQLQSTEDGGAWLLPHVIVERDLHWRPRKASECDLPGRGAP